MDIIFGNEWDLEESHVSKERGQLVADDHGAMFIEVSAKSGYNIHVTAAFSTLACEVRNH